MARLKKHKDVEFMVSDDRGRDLYFDTAEEAAVTALSRAISHGEMVVIDVLVSSKAGARWYQGDDGVEQYLEDPDASVFERIEVSAQSIGRIP